jgi:hypothetical protein
MARARGGLARQSSRPGRAAWRAGLAQVRPGARFVAVDHSADPDAPSALEISRAIARHLGHQWDEVLLDEGAGEALGQHPWEAPHPIVLDTSAAAELGYVPAGDYATTVADEVDWLVASARGYHRTPPPRPPVLQLDEPYFAPLLDYAAEDRYLAEHRNQGPEHVRT